MNQKISVFSIWKTDVKCFNLRLGQVYYRYVKKMFLDCFGQQDESITKISFVLFLSQQIFQFF